MEIKTKYNVGDVIYTINEEMKIVCGTIVSVTAYSSKENAVIVSYYMPGAAYIPEHKAFSTKEELLEHLES